MRIALTALLAFTLLATPAQAGWKIDRATKIAQVVWHNPCVDQMRITWVSTATLSNDAHAAAFDCTVRLSAATPLTWDQFCMLVLHEAGHLARYRDPTNTADPEHSSDPESIMHSPILPGEPRCRRNGRPFLERHGLL